MSMIKAFCLMALVFLGVHFLAGCVSYSTFRHEQIAHNLDTHSASLRIVDLEHEAEEQRAFYAKQLDGFERRLTQIERSLRPDDLGPKEDVYAKYCAEGRVRKNEAWVKAFCNRARK